MLYEELKSIENLLEGNEYSDGGTSYCIGFDKIDDAFVRKKRQLQKHKICLML